MSTVTIADSPASERDVHATVADPPAFERNVHVTLTDVEDKLRQLLEQIYENRSYSTTQHQMLEATVHSLEREFIDRLGGMFNYFRANDNQIRAILSQLIAVGGQIPAVQALAGQVPELVYQVAEIKKTMAEVRDQVSSVKHDMATIHELEYLKGDLAEVVNQVGCIQDTVDDTVGTDRIEFQAEERAIYLEHRAEYSGVHEYQAEGTGQAATSNNHTSLAWQLRNLKARVTNLEGTSSNNLRNQVNATVQDQKGLQSHLQRLQVDQQRLQATVASLIRALTSLNPDSASFNLSAPSPASTYFSNGHTAVSTPSPASNHDILSAGGSLKLQRLTGSRKKETGTFNGNTASETHRSNYQAPTVEDSTDFDESPTINRSPHNKLNPYATPFIFAPTSTHAFRASTDRNYIHGLEMESSKNPAQKASHGDANKSTEENAGEASTSAGQPVAQANTSTTKPIISAYIQGPGLEASMWNPKNKKLLRQHQARGARALSIRAPSRFGSLSLGEQDAVIERAAFDAGVVSATSLQGPSNEVRNQWFTNLTSAVQNPSEEVPSQSEGNLAEDRNQLIPGLEDISVSHIVGSGPELSGASAMSLLDDNGDISNVRIPVLTTRITQAQATNASGAANDHIQGAETSVAVVSKGTSDTEAATIITFDQVKIRVQAGKVGAFVRIGHLDGGSFKLMSIKLVIVIEKAQPMKVKIVGTIKGGAHDGEVAGAAEFIVPTYIHRGSLALESGPVATEDRLTSEALLEFNAAKAAAMGELTGNIHRLSFAYTAPNVTDNMKILKASGDQALAKKFFTALWNWSGGVINMLFLDEVNDSQVVSEVLGELAKQCKA